MTVLLSLLLFRFSAHAHMNIELVLSVSGCENKYIYIYILHIDLLKYVCWDRIIIIAKHNVETQSNQFMNYKMLGTNIEKYIKIYVIYLKSKENKYIGKIIINLWKELLGFLIHFVSFTW